MIPIASRTCPRVGGPDDPLETAGCLRWRAAVAQSAKAAHAETGHCSHRRGLHAAPMVGDPGGPEPIGGIRRLCRAAFRHQDGHQRPDLPRSAVGTARAGIRCRISEREILVVVDAPTPELVEQAATRLHQALAARSDLFPAVRQPQSGSFFARNGLLYLPTDEVRRLTDWLTRGEALIGTLAADVSLRGTLDALSLGLKGVQRKELTLDDMTRPLTMAADTAEAVLAGRPATFSWQVLVNGKPADASDLRRFVEGRPKLDFSAAET